MGRIYTIVGENLSLGTGSVLATINPVAITTVPAAGSLIAIRRVEVSQSGSTTSAISRLALSSRDSAGTLTVTSVTPTSTIPGSAASAIAGATNALTAGKCGINSSADSGGTYTNLWVTAPNVLNGWLWVPTPQEIMYFVGGSTITVFCVRFVAAPTSTTGYDVSVMFEEIF